MKKFDPLDFGFVKLDLQNGSLCFYEYRSGEFCDGRIDRHRLNVYLTQDGSYVTIWHGLFDPALIDRRFHDCMEKVGGLDFGGCYNTDLLRGYIDTEDEAKVILKAIRYESFHPSAIRIDEKMGFVCGNI